MSRQPEHMNDEGHLNWYYHSMLNMADDDLDPYEYRLLGHYRRVCGLTGKCTQSVREIATVCRMSVGKVSETRKKLAENGWITAIRVQEKGADVGYIVTMIDRMQENVARYADKAKRVHHTNTSVHDANTGVQDMKQRSNKNKKQQEKIAAAEAVGDPLEGLTPEQLFDRAAQEGRNKTIIPLVVEEKPKARARRPYFDLIVELFGLDYGTLTATEKKGIGKVESELKKTGRSLDDVRTIFKYCQNKFTDFKWFALTSNAAMALKGKAKPAAAVHIEPEPEHVITEAERAANLELMRANNPFAKGKVSA